MNVDSHTAEQLISVVLPIMVFWFIIGLFITIFYHLSLYYIDGEFRHPDELLLDLTVAAFRFPLYLFAWPAMLYFDRTALHNIKLFWRWLEPKNRERDDELRAALAMREHRNQVKNQFEAGVSLLAQRKKELATATERKQRLRRLNSDNPELERIWLLIGVGASSPGAKHLVPRYPDAILPTEFDREVTTEIKICRPWKCLRCGERIEPVQVVLPEPFYLQIIEKENPLIEGWAYQGNFHQKFPACPKCGISQPAMDGDLTIFGQAKEVVMAIRQGLNYVEEPQEPIFSRLINTNANSLIRLVVGLFTLVGVLIVLGIFAWSIGFFIFSWRSL